MYFHTEGTSFGLQPYIKLRHISAYMSMGIIRKLKKMGSIILAPVVFWQRGGVLSRIGLHIVGNALLHNMVEEDVLEKIEGLFYTYNSVLVLAESICFFMIFVRMRRKIGILDKHAKIIRMLGKLCFAAYLISENGLLREPLWRFVNATAFVGKGVILTLAYSLLMACVILLSSCLIEWMRLKLFSFLRVPIFLQKIDRMALKSIEFEDIIKVK